MLKKITNKLTSLQNEFDQLKTQTFLDTAAEIDQEYKIENVSIIKKP
jgi:hypothetical protein